MRRLVLYPALTVLAVAFLGCRRQVPPETQPATEVQTQTSVVIVEDRPATTANQAIDRGVRYLRSQQLPDGSYESDIGITALVVKALASSPRKYREGDGPFVGKAVEFLLANQKEDGGIRGQILGTYTTSIAVMALEALENPEYEDEIGRAVGYLKKQQMTAAQGYDPQKHHGYGGFGYGGSERPDVSNTQMVLEAFESAGLSKDDPAYKDVVVFLSRCQNNSETNDQVFAGTDGGVVYNPVQSFAGEYEKPDGTKGLRSYGSMTYAFLKSMIYANVSKDDPRLAAAYGWIQQHYTLDENPELGPQGLYYYYHTFARTMAVWGDPIIVNGRGISHDWRKELTAKLLSLQRPDGSWVNADNQWWEDKPVLATCYAVLALEEAAR